MPPDSTSTRDKLVAAAEHLFARRGLDAPIRDIHALAGQRNASALQYHFGDKNGLLRAILQKHSLGDDEIRAVQKDLGERHPDARLVVEAIVERFRPNLATSEGRDWMRITSQALLRAPVRQAMIDTVADGLERPLSPSLQAMTALIRTHVSGLPDAVVAERALAALAFMMFMIAERARSIDDEETPPPVDEQLFVDNLVDMTVGALTAPTRTAATAPTTRTLQR